MIIATDAACDTVRTIAEQTFNQSTSTITLDGTGTDALLLPELPVTSAGTVTVAGGTITDYVLNTRLGMLIRKARHGRRLHERVPDADVAGGPSEHHVTYQHGYADADLPRDVRMVALSIASRLVVQGVAVEESNGPVSVKYPPRPRT
jgi:hypothetical protein